MLKLLLTIRLETEKAINEKGKVIAELCDRNYFGICTAM
jgi:hypothetical protein